MQYKFKVGDVVSGVSMDKTGDIVETLKSGVIEDQRKWLGKPAYTVGNGIWLEKELTLIESKNMFKIGPYNKKFVNDLLEYIATCQGYGLCGMINLEFGSSSREKAFLKNQDVFKTSDDFPIEIHIGKIRKRSKEKSKDTYYQHGWDSSQTSPKHAEGRLRSWWAYNLAVAASNIENLGG